MAKSDTDWEAIERDYRCGVMSLKAIGSAHGVSDAGIIKHARKEGWSRDLRAKIRAKADAKVSADAVSAEVRTLTKVSENQIVEANAELQVRIRREQRGDIQRMRALVVRFIKELEDDDNQKDVKKKLPLQNKVAIVQKLADTHRTVVTMEREHFGITSRFGDDENPAAVAYDPIDTARKIAFLFARAVDKGV